MIDLVRALSAETLRLRRTLALTLTLVGPAFVGVIVLLIGTRRKIALPVSQHDAWLALFQSVWTLWALMMLPLLITAITALIAQIDHGPRAFKQLYSTPAPRWTIYAAKLLIASALACAASITAAISIVAAGFVLTIIKPDTHPLGLRIPLPDIAVMILMPWCASLLLVALHTWIAMRWRSFVVAVTIGILGTFSGLAFLGAAEGFYYPWLMPMYALPDVRPNNEAGPVLGPAWLSILGWAVLGVLGCWHVTRRDVDV